MEILKLDHYKSIDTITTEEGFMDNPATGQNNQSFKHLGDIFPPNSQKGIKAVGDRFPSSSIMWTSDKMG